MQTEGLLCFHPNENSPSPLADPHPFRVVGKYLCCTFALPKTMLFERLSSACFAIYTMEKLNSRLDRYIRGRGRGATEEGIYVAVGELSTSLALCFSSASSSETVPFPSGKCTMPQGIGTNATISSIPISQRRLLMLLLGYMHTGTSFSKQCASLSQLAYTNSQYDCVRETLIRIPHGHLGIVGLYGTETIITPMTCARHVQVQTRTLY